MLQDDKSLVYSYQDPFSADFDRADHFHDDQPNGQDQNLLAQLMSSRVASPGLMQQDTKRTQAVPAATLPETEDHSSSSFQSRLTKPATHPQLAISRNFQTKQKLHSRGKMTRDQ